MNEEFETIDSLNDEQVIEIEQASPDVEKLKDTNAKLYERAKKAEAELRALKNAPKPDVKEPTTNQYVSKEEYEVDLLKTAKGYDDETIDHLKAIAKGKGMSLINAQADPLFSLVLAKKEDEAREAKSKLGASKGSGTNTPVAMNKLSREDHMKLVKEMTGH